MSKPEWYSSTQISDDEKWFLLLSEQELNNIAINQFPIISSEDKFEIDGYSVLVFPKSKWEDISNDTHFVYNFNLDTYSINCSIENGKRILNKDSISYGPYMKVRKDDTVNIKIQGENLDKAKIEIYSLVDNLYIEPNKSEINENNIEITYTAEYDINQLEFVIKNIEDNIDPIVLNYEEIWVD